MKNLLGFKLFKGKPGIFLHQRCEIEMMKPTSNWNFSNETWRLYPHGETSCWHSVDELLTF
jgi:hypothetical protein